MAPLSEKRQIETVGDIHKAMRIIDAACRMRDHDYNHDCSALLEELDAAVDAWRGFKPKKRPTSPA